MKQVVNQLSCSKRSKESLRVILEEQLELNHSKVICDDLVELQNYPRGVKQEKDIDDKKKKKNVEDSERYIKLTFTFYLLLKIIMYTIEVYFLNQQF